MEDSCVRGPQNEQLFLLHFLEQWVSKRGPRLSVPKNWERCRFSGPTLDFLSPKLAGGPASVSPRAPWGFSVLLQFENHCPRTVTRECFYLCCPPFNYLSPRALLALLKWPQRPLHLPRHHPCSAPV